jgi:hypothetical protein
LAHKSSVLVLANRTAMSIGLEAALLARVDIDPFTAVVEIWNPARFDEIVVSTLPASTSRWMQAGLPGRIERHTGALVRHVEAREALVAAARRPLVGGRT